MTGQGTPRAGLLVLTTLTIFLISPAVAGPSRPTFDYVSRLPVPPDAALLVRGDFNGDGLPDLLAAGARGFSVYLQGHTSFEWSGTSGKLGRPASFIATGRLNGDRRDDLVAFSTDPPGISVYITGRNGVPVLKNSFGVQGDFGNMTLADVDGDGKTDILLFGKKTPGIEVFRGDGGGIFESAGLLHPDISISLLSVAQMDGDELADLVAVDWVSNRVLVSSGFGKMNFSDPAVIPCDVEPSSLGVGDLNRDGIPDIVTGFSDPPGFEIFTSDGSGRYTRSAGGTLPAAPERIGIGDVDGDASNDLAIFTPAHGSVSVRYFDRDRPFEREQVVSTGSGAREVRFFLDARKRLLNAAVLPGGGSVVKILHNGTDRFPGEAGWEFVTGTRPGGMEFADLNSDSWTDVILAQRTDPSVSIFMNNGRGNLRGMVSVAIPGPVKGLMPLPADNGETAFVTTGMDEKTLSCMIFSGPVLTEESRMITVDERVEAVDARHRGTAPVTRIYATRESSEGTNFRLSAFDVAANNRYEELEIPVALGNSPLGTLSHDFNGDGARDFAVVSGRDSTGSFLLRTFLQTPDGFEPDREAVLDLGDSGTGPDPSLLLWGGDLNGDGHDDLVINGSRPFERLWISFATGDSGFAAPDMVLDGVRIPERQGLAVVDFNSDGVTDLVFLNEKTRTIQFLPGDGGGEFSGPVNLMSARDAYGIGVADLNRDSEQELLVTGGEQGTLTITSFHHPLFERRKKSR